MGISISISPVAIILIIIVLSNWLISFGKSNLLNKCYLLLSFILSGLGIVGMIIIRPRFIESLNKNAGSREFSFDFLPWAIEKFDAFAFIFMIMTCSVIILLLLYLFLNKNKGGFVWVHLTGIVAALTIINFVAGVWYGLGTINKLFDIAGYISQLSVAGFFALHLPLAVKRILLRKK